MTKAELKKLMVPVLLEKRLTQDVVKLAKAGKITREQYESLLEGLPHPSYP